MRNGDKVAYVVPSTSHETVNAVCFGSVLLMIMGGRSKCFARAAVIGTHKIPLVCLIINAICRH